MNTDTPVALITGSARRIGAQLSRRLHANNYRVVIHYLNSETEAKALADELNAERADSAIALKADLNKPGEIDALAKAAVQQWQRLDVLINNASSFYPTPVGQASPEQWDDLINSNLKAPFFLTQALVPALREAGGCVLNIADIHADRPLKNHPIYCAAKAGNVMLTKSLARELAPEIRVNGIAPGAILWPEHSGEFNDFDKQKILSKIPLERHGDPSDIAETALFLITRAPYITGQIISVDGGRTLI